MKGVFEFLAAVGDNHIFDVVLGAIVAIAFAIIVENLRRPKLKFSIGPSADIQRDAGGRITFRSVRVTVTHIGLLRGCRWMLRGPASQCRATVTFHHLDGQNVFGRGMQARWAGTPEPVLPMMNQGQIVFVLDPHKVVADSRVDIFPEESETLDVAVRFDNDAACYGWNNETYTHPDWKNPNWTLPPGRYLVKVSVTSLGQTRADVFRLINDVAQTDFRLERATKRDRSREGLDL